MSTPTESDTKTNSRDPAGSNIMCIKSPLTQNWNNPKRQKILGEKFSSNRIVPRKEKSIRNKENLPPKKNDVKRTTRNTSEQKSLTTKPVESEKHNLDQHNSSLFSELSRKSSGSKNSSLSSSLSPSPNKNHRSSLLSTISMKSKESHDSSGSVYVSATDSLSSTSDCNVKSKNRKEDKFSKEKENNYKRNSKDSRSSGEDKNGKLKTRNESKNEKDDSKNGRFSTRQLRSRKIGDFSSLMTSISSNESISLVNSSNVKQFTKSNIMDSRKQNDKSSIISGIEKLNLTEDEKLESRSRLSKSPVQSQSSKAINTGNTNTSHVLEHSSLFSSINSYTSRNDDEKIIGEVISISSDSSFDPNFSELSIKDTVKESIALCNDTANSIQSNVSNMSELENIPSSRQNSKADTHASLYSTIGNVNLTCGVKIRKSKYFFNSSDKSISSIGSEPSCIESSIMPGRGNKLGKELKKMIGTPELNEVEEDGNDFSSDKTDKLTEQFKKDSKQPSKSANTVKSNNTNSRNIDDLYDKTKVFNGEKWAEKISNDREESSFEFKEPTSPIKPNEVFTKDAQDNIDLSTWGTNSRGTVKIKVDRYSLNFNFNKLMGKPETTSTETLDNFSSDVKNIADVSKRKSINRDLRKSIEIKRSAVISSDSEADTDDEIRVVSKTRRKQRILDSSDEQSASSGIVISSDESEYEDIKPKSKDKKKKKCQLLNRLTDNFSDILT